MHLQFLSERESRVDLKNSTTSAPFTERYRAWVQYHAPQKAQTLTSRFVQNSRTPRSAQNTSRTHMSHCSQSTHAKMQLPRRRNNLAAASPAREDITRCPRAPAAWAPPSGGGAYGPPGRRSTRPVLRPATAPRSPPEPTKALPPPGRGRHRPRYCCCCCRWCQARAAPPAVLPLIRAACQASAAGEAPSRGLPPSTPRRRRPDPAAGGGWRRLPAASP